MNGGSNERHPPPQVPGGLELEVESPLLEVECIGRGARVLGRSVAQSSTVLAEDSQARADPLCVKGSAFRYGGCGNGMTPRTSASRRRECYQLTGSLTGK